MLPIVLLLLSVFTVRGSACDDTALRSLLVSIRNEEEYGFSEVFPKNYYVQHRFNGSTQCEDACCVFRAAFLLSDSWKQLLQHIDRRHLRHDLIVDLIFKLDDIWKGSFQETPDPSIFLSVLSLPVELLNFTSDVLAKWQKLKCPLELSCVFSSPAPLVTDKKEESKYGTEGEREKRWLTVTPTNRELSASPTFFLCILCCLRMLLDVMLKELG